MSEKVHNTKVLLCSLDARFDELLTLDLGIYSRFYPGTSVPGVRHISDLLRALDDGYDIVHVFSSVSTAGSITDAAGETLAGVQFIQNCSASGVKLLWLANDNEADRYVRGFKAPSQRINLVMTIHRAGPRFTNFLDNLLSRMSQGQTMPKAWVALSPQASSDVGQQDLPGMIFAAGLGSATFQSASGPASRADPNPFP